MDKERSAEKLGGRTTRYWRRRPMKDLTLIRRSNLPAVFAAAGERASIRFLEFFAANIRNPRTPPGLLPCCR